MRVPLFLPLLEGVHTQAGLLETPVLPDAPALLCAAVPLCIALAYGVVGLGVVVFMPVPTPDLLLLALMDQVIYNSKRTKT